MSKKASSPRNRVTVLAAGALVTAAGFVLYQSGVVDLGDISGSAQPRSDGTEAASADTDADVDGALRLLDELRVEDEEDPPGYDRALFPHWDSGVQGNCTTRQVVLLRDGEDVEVDDDCQPVSGSWYSEFDGETVTAAEDVDVDHMVPLKEAWRSGAHDWTTGQRQLFANDLDTNQLWAVTASSNRSKSDSDPGNWLPPLESFHCDYAAYWIEVKHEWDLSVNPDEGSALREMLSGC